MNPNEVREVVDQILFQATSQNLQTESSKNFLRIFVQIESKWFLRKPDRREMMRWTSMQQSWP